MKNFFVRLNNLLFPKISLLIAFTLGPLGIIYLCAEDPKYLVFTFFAFILFDSLGVQIGTHKLLSHESFQVSPFTRNLLSVLSVLSGQGSPLVWASIHRNSHHAHTDTELDFHSPTKGWFHAFIAWFWRFPASELKFYGLRKVLKDPFLRGLHQFHFFILIGYWLVLLCIDKKWAFSLGFAPSFLSLFFTGLVNANLHRKGNKIEQIFFGKYKHLNDSLEIYNSRWLGVITFGLGYHHNHHLHPKRTFNDEGKLEWDPSRLIIPLLKKV